MYGHVTHSLTRLKKNTYILAIHAFSLKSTTYIYCKNSRCITEQTSGVDKQVGRTLGRL